MARQSLSNIQKIITFKPHYQKVKTFWTNTLSFLVGLLDEEKRTKLIQWMTKDHLDIIINFEEDKINEEQRFEILKIIYNQYKNDDRFINWQKYDLGTLMGFTSNDLSFDFLVQEVKSESTHIITRQTAMALLRFFNKEKLSLIQNNTLKNLAFDSIKNVPKLVSDALHTLHRVINLEEKDIDELVKLIDKTDTHRYVIFNLIREHNLQDKYLNLLINEYNSPKKYYLGNVKSDAKRAINSVKTGDGIAKVLEIFSENYRISKTIKKVIQTATQLQISDSQIYKQLKNWSLNNYYILNFKENESAPIIDYFIKTGQDQKIFDDLYKAGYLPPMFADATRIQFIASEYFKGNIKRGVVECFQKELGELDKQLMHQFNQLINQKESFDLPTYRNYKKEQEDELKQKRLFVFNKKAFIAEVIKIFEYASKDKLTKNDYWELYQKYYNTAPFCNLFVLETLQPYRKEIIIKEERIEYLNKEFETIHNFLGISWKKVVIVL